MNDEDHLLLASHDEQIKDIINEVNNCKQKLTTVIDAKRERIDKLSMRMEFIESRMFKLFLFFSVVVTALAVVLDHVVDSWVLR